MIIPQHVEKRHAFERCALEYASYGWHVLPIASMDGNLCSCSRGAECESPGKHPVTHRGLKDASNESGQIARWVKATPEANVSIRTGKVSGLWVLDADGDDGIEAVRELERHYGDLPVTPRARTGGGGLHFYFALPADVSIKNSTRLGKKPVDVRGEDGYVIAPPSKHASGNDYAWEVSPSGTALAEAPTWLIKLVSKQASWSLDPDDQSHKSGEPSINGRTATRERLDFATDAGAGEGERHDRALRLVGAHLARNEGQEEIKDAALRWAARCHPPMDESEIVRIVDDLSLTHQETGIGREPDGTWERPVPFEEVQLPKFPSDALPTWQREFVEAEAEATQTPVDLAAMLVLATTAATCAKKVTVQVTDCYSEPLNIFVAVALPPANRKSAVFNDVTAPLREYEEELIHRVSPDIAEKKIRNDIDKKRLEKLQGDAVKGKPEDQECATKAAAALARELDETVIPSVPRLLASDATTERLATLLAENQGRMAVMSPEGDIFDVMAGRYGAKGMANFGVYLNGHAGDDLRVDRVGRPPDFVRQPALTMGLAVQPDVIRGLADKPGFRGRGLLGRFLYSLPVSLIGSRKADPKPASAVIREQYRQHTLLLLNLPEQTTDSGIVPHRLELTQEANRLRLQFAAWIEPQLADTGEMGHFSDWGGKLVGAVLRIAGLLHLAAHAKDPAPWARPIEGKTMGDAIKIGCYLIRHAKAAFNEMGGDPLIADAKAILAWMQRKGETLFSEREAFEGTKGRFQRMDRLRPALTLLISHGFIRPAVTSTKSGRGRRPSPLYEVNPHTQAVTGNSANCANIASAPAWLTATLANSANSANIASDVSWPEPYLTRVSANCANIANGSEEPSSTGNSANCANIANRFSCLELVSGDDLEIVEEVI